jgi:hypothetical protein
MNFKALVLVGLLFAGNAYAGDYGIVTDIKGKARVVGAKKDVVMGQNIQAGASYEIASKSKIVVVEYTTCLEWTLKGPATVSVSSGEPKVVQGDKKKTVNKSGSLGACFKTADVKSASSHEMGGLVLMSGEGEKTAQGAKEQETREAAIEKMKKEAKEHKASNSALLMLVIYSEMNNDSEGVREYVKYLKEKAPDSPFVRQVEKEYGIKP